jgi:hypothetical protein
MDGTASVGVSPSLAAREDHRHPTDTSKLSRDGSLSMTGNLTLAYPSPAIVLVGDLTTNSQIVSYKGGTPRWSLSLGDGQAETGGNAGNIFNVAAFSDTGGYLSSPFAITRAEGRLLGNGVVPVATNELVNKAYVDGKVAGVDLSSKVSKLGDTMTGTLNITAGGYLNVNAAANGWATVTLTTGTNGRSYIASQKNGKTRWEVDLGNSAPETGGNVGSEFFIHRYDDAGNYNSTPLTILRGSGNVGINTGAPQAKLDVNGGIIASQELILTGSETQQIRLSCGGQDWRIASQATAQGGAFYIYDTTHGVYPFALTPAGNCGIGNGSPGYKLDVNGAIKANNIIANLDYSYIGANLQTRPTNAYAVGAIGWNYNTQEVGFWNTYTGAGTNSFVFRQLTSNGAAHTDLMSISQSGNLWVGGTTDVVGKITCGDFKSNNNVQSAGGIYYFQDGNKYLQYGTGVAVNGAAGFYFSDNAWHNGTLGTLTGLVTSQSTNVSHAVFSMTNEFRVQQGALYWDRSTNAVSLVSNVASTSLIIQPSGVVKLGIGYAGRAGQAGAFDGNAHNFYWTSSLHAYIDNVDLGPVAFACDYRIKKDVVPLDSTWDAVKALKPISYTQAEFMPLVTKVDRVKEAADLRKANPKSELPKYPPMYAADNIERWGFIAHELQDTLIPMAATGTKDSPNEIQAPNPLVIIAALTRALQEAMSRIEALEAKIV